MSSRKANQSSPTAEGQSLHDLHRSIVTIYVSPEHYPFYLHKGRLCRRSSFFEKAFHGSFEEATTGSMYLEEDGVDEFKLFEEWLYSEKWSYPRDSVDPSFLLVKLFCFAEKIGISELQNATLDAICDRAAGRDMKEATPDNNGETIARPQGLFGSHTAPIFGATDLMRTTRSGFETVAQKYLPPATSNAIYYAYDHTPESSPLRKLLADIFAFNVKPQAWDESFLTLPVEFMADVLVINMKRLPLRLEDERADFDLNTNKYHVEHRRDDRRSGALDEAAIGDDEENVGVPPGRGSAR
ncbi:MAG: hypothetical protein Q9217_004335 [Psora testacea]